MALYLDIKQSTSISIPVVKYTICNVLVMVYLTKFEYLMTINIKQNLINISKKY